MAKFFINYPIVAMVISILMLIVGAVALISLPVAQYPNITPPEIRVEATYVCADAETIEQSVATPIDNMYRGAQINGNAAPGYSSAQAMAALEQVFAETMPREMGYDYMGMSFQEKQAPG